MPHLVRIAVALAGIAPFIAASPGAAQEPVQAMGEFVGLEGQSHGTVELSQAPIGVLIVARVAGLPEGAHGFHFHDVGACEPPFESAGDHFNPADSPHGFFVQGGPEAGDLPNLNVGPTGDATVELFNSLISLEEGHEASLLDEDGSALIIHSNADDYVSQPSGESGDPVACAVIAQ